jgi:hypothetical protein
VPASHARKQAPTLDAGRRVPSHRAVSAAGTFATIALLAGCGAAAPTTTHPPTASASRVTRHATATQRSTTTRTAAPHGGLIASADAVCAKADAQVRHLTATVNVGNEFATFFARFLAIVRERDSALEGLTSPASEEGQYAKLMQLEAAEYRHLVESEKATLEHNTAQETRLNKETTLPEERDRVYTELGLQVCNGPKI